MSTHRHELEALSAKVSALGYTVNPVEDADGYIDHFMVFKPGDEIAAHMTPLVFAEWARCKQ